MASIIKANQLQDFGGNSILTSDGAGNLTTQKINYPAFHVNLSSDQSLTDNATVKVPFDRVKFDTDNAYDTTNYRFTCPTGQAGKYFFYHDVKSGGDGNTVSLVDQNSAQFRLNGSNLNSGGSDYRNNPALSSNCQGSMIIDLSVGDYVEIYGRVNVNTSTGYFLSGGTNTPDLTHFGGYRIGS